MKVSIIVPIYKVEKYLDKCIKSIINQTYKDIEIILVDDGSFDNCPKICDKYKKIDNRIKVIHKKNGGLSDARNKGIDIACGTYILFVDSDDYIELDAVSYMVNYALKYEADIVSCYFNTYYENTNKIKKIFYRKNNVKVYDRDSAMEKLLYNIKCTPSAWGKLYKRELFKDIRYPLNKICEDIGTTYKLFGKANRVVISTCCKYNYIVRDNSIMTSSFNLNRLDGLDFVNEQKNYISKYFPKLINGALNRVFSECFDLLLVIPRTEEYKEYYNNIINTYRKLRLKVLFDYRTNFMCRVYALFGINIVRFYYKVKNVF